MAWTWCRRILAVTRRTTTTSLCQKTWQHRHRHRPKSHCHRSTASWRRRRPSTIDIWTLISSFRRKMTTWMSSITCTKWISTIDRWRVQPNRHRRQMQAAAMWSRSNSPKCMTMRRRSSHVKHVGGNISQSRILRNTWDRTICLCVSFAWRWGHFSTMIIQPCTFGNN